MGQIGADLREMLTKYNWLKRRWNSGIFECRGKTTESITADFFLVSRVTIVLSTNNAYQVIGKSCQ
jgi:hypothetical protein